MTEPTVQRLGISKAAQRRPGHDYEARRWVKNAREGSEQLARAIKQAGVRP